MMGKNSRDSGLCNIDVTALRFEIIGSNFAEGGTVAVDNMVVHRGFYNGRGTSIADKSMSATVSIDTVAKKVYYNTSSLEKTDLNTALIAITDASAVSFYSDSTLAAVAPDTITEGNVVVLKTADKCHSETYEIVNEQDKILISSGGGVIKARHIYNHASGKFLLAEYNAAGNRLMSVALGNDANFVPIADKSSEGYIYKAFL